MNSHNEKLTNSKSVINYKDDIQKNKKQSCDHDKLCQLSSSSCPNQNNNANKNYYTNFKSDKEKETRNKLELK